MSLVPNYDPVILKYGSITLKSKAKNQVLKFLIDKEYLKDKLTIGWISASSVLFEKKQEGDL
ncbi:MAG: hypothetical protein U9O50_07005 [Acidobacteriota bacterium]|nr:hypothetical protein [Acidobacteriota bacterium]